MKHFFARFVFFAAIIALSVSFITLGCSSSSESKPGDSDESEAVENVSEEIESAAEETEETLVELEEAAEDDQPVDIADETSEKADEEPAELEEQIEPKCLGWDDSTIPSDLFAEYCGTQERYAYAESVRLDKSCKSTTEAFVFGEQAGDYEGMKLVAQRPFRLTKIKAKFKGQGTGKLHVFGDWGRSAPDVEKDLTAPIDVVITAENDGKFIEFDVTDRKIEIHPKDYFWVVYEFLAPTPRPVVVKGCDTGTSESMYNVKSKWSNNFKWMGLGWSDSAASGSTHFAMEVYGDYFCEKINKDYFTDATEKGLGSKFAHSRSAWVDIDDDGWDDAITHSVGHAADCNDAKVFKNNHDGTFTDATADSGLNGLCSNFVLAGDVNNDGHIDLFVGVYNEQNADGTPVSKDHSSKLMLGDGNFHFTTKENSGVEMLETNAAGGFADYDKDGCLDLYVGNWLIKYPNPPAGKDRLFKGNCDGTFTEVTDAAGMSEQSPQYHDGNNQACYGMIWGDYNNDNYPDAFVANYGYGWNFLWENQRDGTFKNVGVETYVSHDDIGNEGGNNFGVDIGDVNNDGYMDVIFATIAHPRYMPWSDQSRLLLNGGKDYGYKFLDMTKDLGIIYDEGDLEPSFVDFDNDGDLDLYMSTLYTGHFARLYRQQGDGIFLDVSTETGVGIHNAQNNSWADYDHDGHMDLLVGENGELNGYTHLFHNDNPDANHFIAIKLTGNGTDTNGSAIGARVRLFSCERTQMREVTGGKGHYGSQKTMWNHFGLGANTMIEKIEITWPNKDATVQIINNPPIDKFILVKQGEANYTTMEPVK